jgi:hypothetical protein
MGYNGPYPSEADVRVCDECRESAEARADAEYAEMEDERAEEDAPYQPRCGTCGGNAVDCYPCYYGRIYKPGECSQITGVW